MPHFVEVVLVQLSYKTREIAVLEVFRENRFGELLVLCNVSAVQSCLEPDGVCIGWTNLQYDKTVTLITPTYYRFV